MLYFFTLEHKEQGIIYSVNGTRIAVPEHHFDFQNTIIKELQTQIDSTNAPNLDWNAVNKQWIEGVGMAQKKLPMHVVYEYCSKEPFFPKPTFMTQPTLKKQFYNHMTNRHETWFHSGSKLGVDFAIYKQRGGGLGVPIVRRAADDLVAMRRLYEIRTKDFNYLEVQLGSRADNNPDLVPQM